MAELSGPNLKTSLLSLAALPRGLKRVQAAAYIGVGTSKFDEMVADGRMPKSRRVDGRKVWDRLELDESFEALPHDGEADDEANPWDGADA